MRRRWWPSQARTAISDVLDERLRQISLGWTPNHDDQHNTWHLVRRALRYLLASRTLPPAEARTAMVKAAALLIAAIELLDRKAADR